MIVIFGAGGDLTRTKLVPTLYNLAKDGLLPENFAFIGNARESLSSEQFRKNMFDAILEQLPEVTVVTEGVEALTDRFHYFSGDCSSPEMYQGLKEKIAAVEKNDGTQGNIIFYLATPPSLFSIVPKHLHAAGLLEETEKSFRRVIIEKPFGRDYESARQLNSELSQYLKESQILRIDHYLGKETVQNIMALRFANNIFEPLWNQHYVDSVQITVAETDGVGTRGGFYDSAGALRDMVPNHLFQLVALIGMGPPNSFDADDVRDEKVKVIRAIRPFTAEKTLREVVRGQYGRGRSHEAGESHEMAYSEEVKVNPSTETETFVAMKLEIDNWRWAGVPFYLRTGKRLAEHETEIVIQFRHVPVQMFREIVGGPIDPNLLTFQIFPREEISLSFAAKIPGTVVRLGRVFMTFDYESSFGTGPKTGYETLIYDAILGDRTLFQRADQVEAAWRIVTPILEAWDTCQCPAFPNYPSGSWGPPEAQALLARDGRYWRERTLPRRLFIPAASSRKAA